MATGDSHAPQEVLDFWFPDNGFWADMESFDAWLHHRMQGGVDAEICARFAALTLAAAEGRLQGWAETPRGRLALLLALDQFPRSLWRDTPGAYAQDIRANLLVLEGLARGHLDPLKPWERLFHVIALGHCEGPDHLARMDLAARLTEGIVAELPAPLAEAGEMMRSQLAKVRAVIERFGRHPHRNPICGRVSTPEEAAYIAAGDFPHVLPAPAGADAS